MKEPFYWKGRHSDPDPGATPVEIEEMERRLGVIFPHSLKAGYLVSNTASIFKNGKLCDEAISGPKAAGGEYKGFLQNLDPISYMPSQIEGLNDWSEDVFEKAIPDTIPFATHFSGGWVCLNYQNDPTRAHPEIWQFDINGTSFDDCFTKVADNFDHFIEMLVSEDDLARFGFD